MLILKNGTLMTMTEAPYRGDIAIENGCIAAVGKSLADNGATVIPLDGAYITPGLIDAHSHIGLMETGTRDSDHNEASDPVTPQMRVIDAINPRDSAFEAARAAGITACIVCPGSINLIGGTCAAIKTAGTVVDEMLLKNPVAMKMALGENPKFRYSEQNRSPKSRMASAAIVRDILSKASSYAARRAAADGGRETDVETQLGMEALQPVLTGELPLKIHAHRSDDIATAIRIAQEFRLRYTLDHCTEGYLIPHLLQQSLTRGLKGVIAGPLLGYSRKRELAHSRRLELPRLLYEQGIPFAICTDYYENPVEMLRVNAALACMEGLPEEATLASITSKAAEISGIDSRVGALRPGLDADIAVFSGAPMDVRSQCLMTLINGDIVYERGRKT